MKENKKTFTYTTRPSVKKKAEAKAHKEGLSLSEKIHQMLSEYVKPKKKIKVSDHTTFDFSHL